MYSYDVGLLHTRIIFNAIIIAIAAAIGIWLAVILFAKGLQTTYGTRVKYKELPLQMKLILAVPYLIVAVIIISLGVQTTNCVIFEKQMTNGNGITLEGTVTLISSEEAEYRDEFLGYSIVFEINGEKYEPANSFPEEVVDAFSESKECSIIYGYLGGELTVWSINLVGSQ